MVRLSNTRGVVDFWKLWCPAEGIIKTDLDESSIFLSKVVKVIKRFWKSPEYGAEAPNWFVINEELKGKYYNKKKVMYFINLVKDEKIRATPQVKTENIFKKQIQ